MLYCRTYYRRLVVVHSGHVVTVIHRVAGPAGATDAGYHEAVLLALDHHWRLR